MKKILLSFLIFTLAGCASSIKSTKEEVAKVAANEGIVVGAFYVLTEKATEEQKKNAGIWKPQVSENRTYTFTFTEEYVGARMFRDVFNLTVKPEKVEYFVRKLPAGKYMFHDMHFPGVRLPFDGKFTVEAGKTLYIGQYNLIVPVQILPGSRFFSLRTNALEEARKGIEAEFPQVARDLQPSKDLPNPKP